MGLNFRGAARGLGQAMVYLGQQGMERQQREEQDQRLLDRQMALARFQQGLNLETDATDRKRDFETNLDRDEQLIDRRARELKIGEEYEAAEDRRTAETQAARDARIARQRRQERAEEPIDTYTGADGRRVYVWPDGRETFSRTPARESANGSSDGRREVDTFTDEEGYRVTVWSDGTETRSQSRARETGRGGDDDDFLSGSSERGAGRAVVDTAVDQVARVAERGRNAPARRSGTVAAPRGRGGAPVPGARQAPDGNWYVQRGGRWYRVEE